MLQVPTNNIQSPPIDASPMNAPFGGDYLDGGNEMPFYDGQQDFQQPQENYDADFNAGVEADEETDPKKYIQQLTGKLSQSLRKYNQSLPQPDSELCKYVSGMILKQSTEGLPQEDVSDIIKKVKSDDDSQDNVEGMEQFGNDEGMEMGDDGQPMNERTIQGSAAEKKPQKNAPSKIRKSGYARKPYRQGF